MTLAARSSDALIERGNRLLVEGVDVEALAERFGTPLHVMSEGALRAAATHWREALADAWPEGPTLVMPSLKANTSLALRRVLNEEGVGCDVFGRHELELALRAGVPPARISLNGATKDRGAIRMAVAHGARVTLDSLDELRVADEEAAALGRQAQVRLRVRPWLEASTSPSDFADGSYPAYLAVHDYRAGLPLDEARTCAAAAQASPHSELTGVMAHVTRQTVDLGFWRAYGSALAAMVTELVEAAPGWRPREIDLGGGFATRRDPTSRALAHRRDAPDAPGPRSYLEAVVSPLRQGLKAAGLPTAGVALEIEPGRAMYAAAGVHLTRVRHVKHQDSPVERTWIETDTSEVFLPDTIIERNGWSIRTTGGADRQRTAAVTGISCGWDELLAPQPLPAVEAGDVLVFLDTGAYQDAASSNFNAMGRPATVLVRGTDAEVIKRRETLEDITAREQMPAWLTS